LNLKQGGKIRFSRWSDVNHRRYVLGVSPREREDSRA
jgi:hypothetical protein